MSEPPMWTANPKSHRTKRTTIIVQSIDGAFQNVAAPVWGLQAYNECGVVVGLNAAFVRAGGFEYRLRRIGALDPGACNRERCPGGTEEVLRAG